MSTNENRFELPSAKNYSIEKAVEIFVPTESFWSSLNSDSHDVILGTRGSGKTMLLRMMSVPHLVQLARDSQRAHDALYSSKRFGIFLPMGIDWCVAYQDPLARSPKLFFSGVNLVAADALVEVLDTLLRDEIVSTPDANELERQIAEELDALWFRKHDRKIHSFLTLKLLLSRQQAILRDVWRGSEPPSIATEENVGYAFREAPLFVPIEQAARTINRLLGLSPDHRWLLCLDELEDLQPDQKRAIRTALRASQRTLTLKITAQPYTWATSSTAFAEEATAVDFRDYELRRLQYDPGSSEYRELALAILCKRLRQPLLAGTGEDVFGRSTFAHRAAETNLKFQETEAKRLSQAGNADSARKSTPVMAIRSLRQQSRGHRSSTAYSGWEAVVRVSDGNPGVFVRMLNEMHIGQDTRRVSPELQHAALRRLASSWHEWSRALDAKGRLLHAVVGQIGRRLSAHLHASKHEDANTDEEVNQLLLDLHSLSPDLAAAFRIGARHSLFVAEELGAPLRYPEGEGVWRLAYFLAPKYWLLPRKGRVVKLSEGQLRLGFVEGGAVEVRVEAIGQESMHEAPEEV